MNDPLTPVEAITREIERVKRDIEHNIETQPTDDCLNVVRDSRVELAALELALADAELAALLNGKPASGRNGSVKDWHREHKRLHKQIAAARANLYEALQR